MSPLRTESTPRRAVQGTLSRVAWGVLIVVPLSAWLALAVATLTHQPRSVRTGDKLHDTFLQGLVDTDVLGDASLLGNAYEGGLLSERQWRLWEKEFGADPRFWTLCHYFRNTGSPGADEYYSELAAAKLRASCKYLEEARRRGVADATVLALLLRVMWWDYWGEVPESSRNALGQPYAGKSFQESAAYLQARRELEGAASKGRLDALLHELLSVAPDQALTQLVAAVDDFEQQRYDVGLDKLRLALEASSSCPLENSTPGGWYTGSRNGRPLKGDPALAGCVSLLDGQDLSIPNDYLTRDLYVAVASKAAEHGDYDAVNALHQLAWRLSQVEGDQGLYMMLAGRTALSIEDAVETATSGRLTPERSRALGELKSKLQALRAQFRQVFGPSQTALNWPSGWEATAVFRAKEVATRGRFLPEIPLRGL